VLQLDVLSSFAICGAGALVGAAMLRPSLAHDAAGAESLRICRAGYALVGIALVQPVALELPLPLWSQATMAFGTVGGVVMIGWALAVLAGNRISHIAIGATIAAVFAVVLAALPVGTQGVTVVCALGLAGASVLTVWLGRRLVWRSRDVHERLIGVTLILMVLSSLLRASYLWTWHGPYESHLMYVPPMMVTPFTLMYGVLPVVFATLLHNVINARLLVRLHQRAMVDQLTGSLSRHALADGAATLIAAARQGEDRLAVIMLDLDLFKQINDRHGHAGGDAVLRHAAQVLQVQLRGDALLVRYGGEEFVALAPVSDLHSARRVAERMRMGLEQTSWTDVLPGLVTVGDLVVCEEALDRVAHRAAFTDQRIDHHAQGIVGPHGDQAATYIARYLADGQAQLPRAAAGRRKSSCDCEWPARCDAAAVDLPQCPRGVGRANLQSMTNRC